MSVPRSSKTDTSSNRDDIPSYSDHVRTTRNRNSELNQVGSDNRDMDDNRKRRIPGTVMDSARQIKSVVDIGDRDQLFNELMERASKGTATSPSFRRRLAVEVDRRENTPKPLVYNTSLSPDKNIIMSLEEAQFLYGPSIDGASQTFHENLARVMEEDNGTPEQPLEDSNASMRNTRTTIHGLKPPKRGGHPPLAKSKRAINTIDYGSISRGDEVATDERHANHINTTMAATNRSTAEDSEDDDIQVLDRPPKRPKIDSTMSAHAVSVVPRTHQSTNVSIHGVRSNSRYIKMMGHSKAAAGNAPPIGPFDSLVDKQTTTHSAYNRVIQAPHRTYPMSDIVPSATTRPRGSASYMHSNSTGSTATTSTSAIPTSQLTASTNITSTSATSISQPTASYTQNSSSQLSQSRLTGECTEAEQDEAVFQYNKAMRILGKVRVETAKPSAQGRLNWTGDDSDLLVRMVYKDGPAWAKFAVYPRFKDRTAAQIKDRARVCVGYMHSAGVPITGGLCHVTLPSTKSGFKKKQ